MKLFISALVLLLVIVGCQKDVEDQIPPGDCRLVRMVHGTHNGQLDDTSFLFEYDNENRLSLITMISEGFPIDFNLEYDAEGRLIKVSQPDDPAGFFESTFTYNSDGRLKEIFYQRFSDPSKFLFEYGSDSLPVRSIQSDLINGQWEELLVSEYNYQGGNMVKSDIYIDGVYKWSHHFEYDNTLPNKLGDLPLVSYNSIPLGYYEEFLFFNKNLPKKLSHAGGSDYHFRYIQDSGRVVQSIGSYVHPPSTDTTQRNTRNFFFECK